MNIKKLWLALSLAGLALGASACKDDDSCAALTKQICEGSGISCDAAKTWLDKEMVGPNDEKLSGEERSMACKMILDEKDALTGYKEKAKSDLAAKK